MIHKRKKIVLIVACCAAGLGISTSAASNEINLLFIGNSFTFRHDLDLLVKQVIEEGQPGVTVNTRRVVFGGQSLYQHTDLYFSQSFIEMSTIDNATINARIAQMESLIDNAATPPDDWFRFWALRGQTAPPFSDAASNISRAISDHQALLSDNPRTQWDYVVLQSWQDVFTDFTHGYGKYAPILANIATNQGAKVILYVTAPNIQNAPGEAVPKEVERVAREIELTTTLSEEIHPECVVHMPLAINRIQTNPDWNWMTFCYTNDFHPNQRCAYLTSNMFYAEMYNENTEGFSYDTVTETNPKEYPEGFDPDGGPATVTFAGGEKAFLQRMAYKATREFESLRVGYNSRNTSAPVFFSADFSGSQSNTNAINVQAPVPDPFGGLDNLNAGTSNGTWTADALLGSSVYEESGGNKLLFAGSGSYSLTANLAEPATIDDGVNVSFSMAVCRMGNAASRRSYVTGLDSSGERVFRLWVSGNGLDDGGRTLYIETSSSTNLLAPANSLARYTTNYDGASLSLIALLLNTNGVTVSLSGTELTNGVPFYTAGVTDLDRLVFEGDSNWFDDISVWADVEKNLDYAAWSQSYELSQGPLGDDDSDGTDNLSEFGLGGVPTNAVKRGGMPVIQLDGGSAQLVHPWRKGTLYSVFTSGNLLSNDWNKVECIQAGFSPTTNGYGVVTNLLDEPVSDMQFVQLRME